MIIKDTLKELKVKFPEVIKVKIEYQGSGDSFDSFWNMEVFTKKDKESKISQEDVEDILWYAIENSDANFNNEGSEGIIEINLVRKTVSIDNYYIIYERESSGKITLK